MAEFDDIRLHHLCLERDVVGFDDGGTAVRAYLVTRDGKRVDYVFGDGERSARPALRGRLTDLDSARRQGRLWGAAWGQNPWELAQAYSVPVNLVPRAYFGAPPGRRVMGRTRAGEGIWIDETLSEWAQTETLGHELAHWCDPDASEALCDAWAAGFLGVVAIGVAA